MALAGVAVGAEELLTLTTPTGLFTSDSTLSWTQDYDSLDSWKLTFNINWSTNNGEMLFSTYHATDDNESSKGAVKIQKSGGLLRINLHKTLGVVAEVAEFGVGDYLNQDVSITFSYIADETSTGELTGGGVFTLTAASGGVEKTCSYTVPESNVLFTALKPANAGSPDDAAWLYTNNGNSTISNVALYKLDNNVLPIPEPATATLSLLALAGLAMRRRRK